jgi:hypothetical protein
MRMSDRDWTAHCDRQEGIVNGLYTEIEGLTRECDQLKAQLAQEQAKRREAIEQAIRDLRASDEAAVRDWVAMRDERDQLQAQVAALGQGARAREMALDEARGLFERAMSALVRADLTEEAHELARQASWLEVRERVLVLGDEAEESQG